MATETIDRRAQQQAAETDWLLEATGADPRGFFAQIGVPLPSGTGSEAMVACFANPGAHKQADKHASCSVNLISGVWCCHGCGEKGNPYSAAVAMGHTNKQAAELAKTHGLFAHGSVTPQQRAQSREMPGEEQIAEWAARLAGHDGLLAQLRRQRGWSPVSVRRLGLGWDGERIVFPVRDSTGRLVGVARYLPWREDGERKMVALPGSRRDLFPAPEPIITTRTLWLVEGEPDAVAGWSLGLITIAIPGSGSWRREWAARLKDRDVLVCCDSDQPGRDLAERVWGDLQEHAARVRVIDLAPERDDGYDLGDFLGEAIEFDIQGLQCTRQLLDHIAAAA